MGKLHKIFFVVALPISVSACSEKQEFVDLCMEDEGFQSVCKCTYDKLSNLKNIGNGKTGKDAISAMMSHWKRENPLGFLDKEMQAVTAAQIVCAE